MNGAKLVSDFLGAAIVNGATFAAGYMLTGTNRGGWAVVILGVVASWRLGKK